MDDLSFRRAHGIQPNRLARPASVFRRFFGDLENLKASLFSIVLGVYYYADPFLALPVDKYVSEILDRLQGVSFASDEQSAIL